MKEIQPLHWSSLVDCAQFVFGLPRLDQSVSVPVVVMLERTSVAVDQANEFLPQYLSPEELRRLEQYRRSEARDLFLLGRGGLRLLLGTLLDIEPEALQIAQNQYGKPRLFTGSGCARLDSSGYQIPHSLNFSLSHASNLVLFAFHARCSVGVDVEVNRPGVMIDADIRRMLQKANFECSAPHGGYVQFAPLLPAWCRAEARLKALGTGVDQMPRLLQEAIAERDPMGWEVAVPAGYYAYVSLCDANNETAPMLSSGGTSLAFEDEAFNAGDFHLSA